MTDKMTHAALPTYGKLEAMKTENRTPRVSLLMRFIALPALTNQ